MKLGRLLLGICSVAYFLALCIVCTGQFWPSRLSWLDGLIEMSPVWVLCFPVIVLIVATILARMRKTALFNLISCIVLIFFVMGYNIPLSLIGQKKEDSGRAFRIATCNRMSI